MGAQKADETKSRGWLWWLLVLVLAALVVAAAVLTLLNHFKHSKPSGGVSGRPGPIVAEYANALEIAMQFFDVQKCINNTLYFVIKLYIYVYVCNI